MHEPIHIHIIQDGSDHKNSAIIGLYAHLISPDGHLYFAARSAGKGRPVKNAPKGWEIRLDPAGEAYPTQKSHYHCKRGNDTEVVVTVDGYGSHKTRSGDGVPRKLGDFLVNDCKVPLKEEDGEFYIRLIVHAESIPLFQDPADFLEELLNSIIIEITEFPVRNPDQESE